MANITSIGSITRYKNSVCNVCFYTSLLAKYAEELEEKKPVKDGDIVYATTMLKKFKQYLLIDKEMLGFTDGLSFLSDNHFRGFCIENGRFYGDRSGIKDIVEKWVKGFPDTANNYQYEVSMLVLALAFPDELSAFMVHGYAAA